MSTPFAFAFWQPNHAYPANSYVFDGTGNIQLTTGGGTSGAHAPAWTTSVTIDNTISWTFVGFGARMTEYQPAPPGDAGLLQESVDATSFSRGTIDAGKVVLLDSTGQLDSSLGGGGGGSVNKVRVTLTFFNPLSPGNEDTSAYATVTGQTWVTINSILLATVTTSPDHPEPDEATISDVVVSVGNIIPGVGFDVAAYSSVGTEGDYYVDVIGA